MQRWSHRPGARVRFEILSVEQKFLGYRALAQPTLGTAGGCKPPMNDYFLGRLHGDNAFPLISNHANR
jgi:hypothetical protein